MSARYLECHRDVERANSGDMVFYEHHLAEKPHQVGLQAPSDPFRSQRRPEVLDLH